MLPGDTIMSRGDNSLLLSCISMASKELPSEMMSLLSLSTGGDIIREVASNGLVPFVLMGFVLYLAISLSEEERLRLGSGIVQVPFVLQVCTKWRTNVNK